MYVRMHSTGHGSRVASALAFEECDPGSIPPNAIYELRLLLLALLQGFFSRLSGFQPSQKPTLQISIRPGYGINMKSSLGGIVFFPNVVIRSLVASQQTNFGLVRGCLRQKPSFGCQYNTAFASISRNRNRGSFVSEELEPLKWYRSMWKRKSCFV